MSRSAQHHLFPAAKVIADNNKFTLKLEEALLALTTKGAWDKDSKSESMQAHATSFTATPIYELKISDLMKATKQGTTLENTPFYMLLSQLSRKESKVKILNLSNYEFHENSLRLLATAIERYFISPTPHEKITSSLQQIHLGIQKELTKDVAEFFEKMTKLTGIKIIVQMPAHKLTK